MHCVILLSLNHFFYSRNHEFQGSTAAAGEDNYEDPGIASDLPIYSIQPSCSANSTWPLSIGQIKTGALDMAFDVRNTFFFTLMIVSNNIILEVKCVQGLCLWRNNSIEVNDELFKGSWRGNSAGMTNEIAAGLLSSAFFFSFSWLSYGFESLWGTNIPC